MGEVIAMRGMSAGSIAGRSSEPKIEPVERAEEWAIMIQPAYLPWAIWRSSMAIWTSLWLAPLGFRVEPMDR